MNLSSSSSGGSSSNQIHRDLMRLVKVTGNDSIRSILEHYAVSIGAISLANTCEEPTGLIQLVYGMKLGKPYSCIVRLTDKGRYCLRSLAISINNLTKCGMDAKGFTMNRCPSQPINSRVILSDVVPSTRYPQNNFNAYRIMGRLVRKYFTTKDEDQARGFSKYPEGVKSLMDLIEMMKQSFGQCRDKIRREHEENRKKLRREYEEKRKKIANAITNHISLATRDEFGMIVRRLAEILEFQPEQMVTYLSNVIRKKEVLRRWPNEKDWTITNVAPTTFNDLLKIMYYESTWWLEDTNPRHLFIHTTLGPVAVMSHCFNHYWEERHRTNISCFDEVALYLQDQFYEYLGLLISTIHIEDKFRHLDPAFEAGGCIK